VNNDLTTARREYLRLESLATRYRGLVSDFGGSEELNERAQEWTIAARNAWAVYQVLLASV